MDCLVSGRAPAPVLIERSCRQWPGSACRQVVYGVRWGVTLYGTLCIARRVERVWRGVERRIERCLLYRVQAYSGATVLCGVLSGNLSFNAIRARFEQNGGRDWDVKSG